MERRGQALYRNRASGFPGRWKSFQCVLSRWLVLLVLIILLCHLGQAELFGSCWAGHSGVPSKGGIFFLPLTQLETG